MEVTRKSIVFKITSQKSKKTTQSNHKMIKWTDSTISWHTFDSLFQFLIYLESNYVRSGTSRSNRHIPDSSRFWHGPGERASPAQKRSFPARPAARGSPAHSPDPPNSHCVLPPAKPQTHHRSNVTKEGLRQPRTATGERCSGDSVV